MHSSDLRMFCQLVLGWIIVDVYLCERQFWWSRSDLRGRHNAQGDSSRRIQQLEMGFQGQAVK